ncbi:preprotein translocase subunit SecG [Ulvibacter sp. MAR_2010_11]|uniref:preprotein translocase subunit SecG n=1 Tax=Ulvibacter sp. MAR_2010_11 TaxID=1250229 RepID=UPI000CC8BF09|nr:preprotein translocase subunit SecG [Ulvibacter sp. MAR_2010_11]PKA82478.1 preprotein translocase subunit SecG [Ulvibacter sp. MAR_2010_11]
MSTFTIFLILIIFVAFLLVVVVMVQNPKGGGLSSSFGGGGTQQLGGVKKTTDFLDKSTWTLATLLLALILLSNIPIMEGMEANDTFDENLIENATTPPVNTTTDTSTDGTTTDGDNN